MFETAEATGTMCLAVDLGDIVAHIDLDAIANSFGIAADSQDAQMLELVRRALAHVKRIAPGDAIPSEILDGTASWHIEPRHLLLSQGRICASLLAWIGERHGHALEPSALMKLAADPQAKASLREAFDRLAAHLGLPPARTGEVLGRVATLAKELAYIEALRERYGKIKMIEKKIAEAGKLYRRERAVSDDVSRIQALIKGPLSEFPSIFKMVYTQMADVRMVLRSVPAQVQFIRTMRDELSVRFMKWEEMIQLWEMIPPERGEMIERALRLTYRFMARHFPQRSEWSLTIAKT